jgi:hypothetical protein
MIGHIVRYRVSKLIEHLLVNELADQLARSTKPGTNRIITSLTNPGWVLTNILNSAPGPLQRLNKVLGRIVARTAEEGGRTLVKGAEGGAETHGKYLDNCKPGK